MSCEPLGVLLGNAVADGVGDVERRRAGVDRDLQHLAHEVEVRSGRVLRRELDVVGVLLGVGDGATGLDLHLIGRHPQLVLHVDLAGGDEDVDAGRGGRLDGLPAPVDVGQRGAGQPTDDGAAHGGGDGLHRFEVALAGDGEAGLDDVDPEAGQLLGDLELLALVERDARRLLAVTEGRVEDDDPVLLAGSRIAHRWTFPCSWLNAWSRVWTGSRERKTSRPVGAGGSTST